MTNDLASSPDKRIRRGSRAALIALAAVTATGTAGCRHDVTAPQVAGWSMVDQSQRHPIIVSQEPQTMQVQVAAASRGLTPRQRAEVLEFADRSRASDAGNSRLIIQAPGGSANEIAAMHAVGEIRQILGDMGFAESSIAVEAYHAESRSNAPVRVSYMRYVAEAPVCGYWPTNLANQRDNGNYPNFGCANQRNLAVMVANPADLIGPRTESDRPSERRDVVWNNYTKGKPTGAEKGEDEKVKIAK
ncbi:CpaD family pilus assembly protein [Hyphomicrobium sp.]|uniref:CpaD family pilus assembly protein n=1 Tax=Hyphomicrobium sp. TaxID=82 RepID=UPI0025B80DFB|nr:CpaD family pilus assembly protein [Hyphomicrobium sp.]MCC7253618.1 CpaD family pilus assembly protein [Hyphomicrobium sp.]